MEPGLELVLLEYMLDVVHIVVLVRIVVLVHILAWVCNFVLVVEHIRHRLMCGLREPLVLGLE